MSHVRITINCKCIILTIIQELLEEQRQLGTCNVDPQSFIDMFAAKVEDSKRNPDTDFTGIIISDIL